MGSIGQVLEVGGNAAFIGFMQREVLRRVQE
jgi:hypothetical protein